MAVIKVRVKINGTWTNLTESSGKWTVNLTAPSTTSYNLSGGYYPAEIEITNDAGTVVTYDSTDATWGSILRLIVKETIKPTIIITSPSNGAYVTNNKQPIVFTVTDETSGSGVNLSTVKLKIDSTTYSYNSTGMVYTAITNGYQFTFTPPTALSDGSHTITVNASDYDGNAGTAVSSTYTVDTVPPTLNISYPASGLITNNKNVTVAGITNDLTSSPVGIKITLGGADQSTVSVGADGSFSKILTLAEGTNTIVVTATDAAGKSSSVTLTVKLDTTIPKITAATFAPNPANSSESVAIAFVVE